MGVGFREMPDDSIGFGSEFSERTDGFDEWGTGLAVTRQRAGDKVGDGLSTGEFRFAVPRGSAYMDLATSVLRTFPVAVIHFPGRSFFC